MHICAYGNSVYCIIVLCGQAISVWRQPGNSCLLACAHSPGCPGPGNKASGGQKEASELLSCSDAGLCGRRFFYIKNSGISQEMVDKAFAINAACASPSPHKLQGFWQC